MRSPNYRHCTPVFAQEVAVPLRDVGGKRPLTAILRRISIFVEDQTLYYSRLELQPDSWGRCKNLGILELLEVSTAIPFIRIPRYFNLF